MRAIGIPVEMFTVMFAIGRMPGWIANYKEILDEPKTRIYGHAKFTLAPLSTTTCPSMIGRTNEAESGNSNREIGEIRGNRARVLCSPEPAPVWASRHLPQPICFRVFCNAVLQNPRPSREFWSAVASPTRHRFRMIENARLRQKRCRVGLATALHTLARSRVRVHWGVFCFSFGNAKQ